MRMALFSWETLYSVTVGGVAVHVSELARSLGRDGNDVHVFTRFGADQPADGQVEGVNYHRCSFWTSPDFVWESDSMCGAFADRFHAEERRGGWFDVVHAHDWLTAMALAWTKNGGGRRAIFTMHSTEYGRCGNRHWDGRSRAIRFPGFRGGRELVELYKACDVVCVPSRNEPFGIVILEAWSAGKPVVATCNGGPSEFVRHGVDGLTIHDNPDSVRWGLGTLFANFEHARWMGRNGRQQAEAHFDWSAIGRQVERVYGE